MIHGLEPLRWRRCPSCGKSDIAGPFKVDQAHPELGWAMGCVDCKTVGPSAPTEDGAMAAWNRWGWEMAQLPGPVPSSDWEGRAHAAEYNFGVQVEATREAERFADTWRETARKALQDADFYRGICIKIGEIIGPQAYISDDGSKQQDVLVLKLVPLVLALKEAAEGKVK